MVLIIKSQLERLKSGVKETKDYANDICNELEGIINTNNEIGIDTIDEENCKELLDDIIEGIDTDISNIEKLIKLYTKGTKI